MRKANEDPLPSQSTDDTQPPPILVQNDDLLSSPEQTVDRILRVEKFRRGKGLVRRVLVKWKGFAEPTWEDRVDLEEVEALDDFEKKFGKGDGVGENEGSRQGPKVKQLDSEKKKKGK